MERLWSPWRMEYLKRDQPPDGCIFCTKLDSDQDRDNLVLFRGRFCAIVLNLFPYNTGHLMVIPYVHVPSIELLEGEELVELMDLVKVSIGILRSSMNPHGFNIGINIGKSAGAGIEEHVHLHIVPRWDGDTNFMQVNAGTRVIPEMLSDTYDRLLEALKKIQSIQPGPEKKESQDENRIR